MNGDCIVCHRLRALNVYWSNPEKARAECREWKKNNPPDDVTRERARLWAENNREKLRSNQRRWLAANREKSRARLRAWRRANPHKKNSETRAYKARKVNSVPKWFDKRAVDKIYTSASWLSLASGISHHVDHIVPLKNSLVCGLHCTDNLQIITASENTKKWNFFSNDEHSINNEKRGRKYDVQTDTSCGFFAKRKRVRETNR